MDSVIQSKNRESSLDSDVKRADSQVKDMNWINVKVGEQCKPNYPGNLKNVTFLPHLTTRIQLIGMKI